MSDEVESADAAIDAIVEDAVPEGPETEEESQPSEEQPRDEETGRFTAAAKDEAEPEAEETPSEEPEAEVSAEPSETPDEPAEEVEETPPEVFPELGYHAYGVEHKIPGTAVGDKGAFIPTESLPDVQRLLASGKAYVRQHREDVQRTEAAVARAEAAEEQARTVLEEAERIFTDPELREKWIVDGVQNWEVLKARSEAASIKKQSEFDRQRLTDREQQDRDAAELPRMQTRLGQLVEGYGKQAGLDPENTDDFAVLKTVYQRWGDQENLDRLFPRATSDDASTGLRKGERYENRDLIRREFEFVQSVRPKAPVDAKIEAAKKINAERKAKEPAMKQKPPKTVSARAGTPAESGKKKTPTFKTVEEADDYYLSDEHLGL